MREEISDTEKKRASNQIWNAAGEYDFSPDFRVYSGDGKADVYWNSLIGLAEKHYEYGKLRKLFRSLESEEDAEIYTGLLWLGLENALVAKEAKARPVLKKLRREYAERFLEQFGGQKTEDDRFYDFLATAHYARLLGRPLPLSRYDLALLDELELPADLDTDGVVERDRLLLQKWFRIRLREKAEEHHPLNLPFLKHAEHRRREKNRVRRFGIGLAEQLHLTEGGSEMPADPESRRSSLSEKELREFMEEKYGRALLRPDQLQELEKKLCTGNHGNCHLHLTKGEAAAVHIRNGFEALQKEKEAAQIARNRAVFHAHETQNRIAIATLTEKIQNSVLLYLRPADVRSNAGALEGGRVWRALEFDDGNVFRRRENADAGDVSVDILLDASTSQKGRLESISGQAYCIAEALTRCSIPCRVMGFCSMTGYTVLRIFRDYDRAQDNGKIFDYVSNGCNRDGLAVRLVHQLMEDSACEHRLLILLSDVKPQDVVRVYDREDDSFTPYEQDTAVRDTAQEVRRARADGIAVICVFTGADEELASAKTVYGRDFARIRSVDQLADTVGLLIQNQIKNL